MGREDQIMEDLYEFKSKMAKVMEKISQSNTTDKNKETIERYKTHLLAKPVGVHRTIIYLRLAKQIAETLPDKNFEEYTRDDVDKVKVIMRPRFSDATMNLLTLTFKTLFRFIEGLGNKETPERVKHLRELKVKSKVTKKKIVSAQEMELLIPACKRMFRNGFMYSVMLSLQWESGARPSEIRGLLMSSVEKLDDVSYSAELNAFKTHDKRNVYLVTSAPLLDKWIDTHPQKDNPDAPLFFMMSGDKCQFVKHHTYLRMMYRLTEKVLGVRKPLYHTRHGRITNLVIDHRSSVPLVKSIVGHSINSKIIENVYLKMDDTDIKNEMKRVAGVAIQQKPIDEALFVRTCPNPKCGKSVASYDAICSYCGELVNSSMVGIKRERPKFDVKTLTDEERDYMRNFMRDELKRMMQEQQQEAKVTV